MKFDLKDLTTVEKQYYLQHIIAPRPICFASTIDKSGHVNLSPFSFFNMFSSNPPIVIFSPSRRVRDNTTKHTLQNVMEVAEVVINMVSYDMVQQTSLASCDFAREDDEFLKAGFTKELATMVSPPMVKESKAKLECKVLKITSLGLQGGAGNLVICEVLCVHIHNTLLNDDKKFDQTKFDLVARLGGDWYSKISKENLFKVPKPNVLVGIGIDRLPQNIRNSKVLTGNHLGKLANVTQIPSKDPSFNADHLTSSFCAEIDTEHEFHLHQCAAMLLDDNKIMEAWQVLIS
ncbi:MAG: flavin reductase family protein [Bacteroidota bacterium]|nr:flavin reductase family protein [Bacteroidota bacterium]